MINLDQEKEKIKKKRNNFKSINALYEDRELNLNAFRSQIFPSDLAMPLKILTPKQIKDSKDYQQISNITNSSCTSKSR